MAVISSIVAGIAAAGAAIASAATATAGVLATTIGATSITIGGALAGLGTAAIGLGSMYQQSRQSAKVQQAQADAIKKLQEQSEQTGTLSVNKTANTLQDRSKTNRTLSSLRISMLPQTQDDNKITQNVYGVDSNIVATSTQNMTGLNIATA